MSKVSSINISKVNEIKSTIKALKYSVEILKETIIKVESNIFCVCDEIECGDKDGILKNTHIQLSEYAVSVWEQIHITEQEIKDLEIQLIDENTELHIYYNGFKTKTDGKFSKIMRGHWSLGEHWVGNNIATRTTKEVFTFYADTYGSFGSKVGSFFSSSRNKSDSMTDYFEHTKYIIDPENVNYKIALCMLKKQDDKNNKRWNKKCGNN